MHSIHSVMITGANAGIGRETARQLALQLEITEIYLACRNPAKAAAAKSALIAETGRDIFEVVILDLADQASIASAVASLGAPIDALVLNAGGLGGATTASENASGVSQMFNTNLLGHTVLVEQLLERQLITSTILLAGSEAAHGIPKLGVAKPQMDSYSVEDFAGIASGRKFDSKTDEMTVYGAVKLTGAVWMGAMARRYPHLRFVTMSPGSTVGTNGLDHLPFVTRVLSKYVFGSLMPLFGMMHRVDDAARRFVDGVMNPRFDSGHFYASAAGAPTGPVIDQAEIEPNFSNPIYQDNAYAAIQRFV